MDPAGGGRSLALRSALYVAMAVALALSLGFTALYLRSLPAPSWAGGPGLLGAREAAEVGENKTYPEEEVQPGEIRGPGGTFAAGGASPWALAAAASLTVALVLLALQKRAWPVSQRPS